MACSARSDLGTGCKAKGLTMIVTDKKWRAAIDEVLAESSTPLHYTDIAERIVEWNAMPKLYGVQQIGADSGDFCRQIGIYLLYDGREVIYVGRSTDRPLGRRLYEHTADRMATRWDRFSWFGLLPVSETGGIGVMPATYPAEKLVPALEAILIEALEPRQNRKRGNDLAAVEYSQKTDPDIDKKKAKALIDRI